MRALGWTPTLSLDIAVAGGALVVRADPAGAFRTTGHGHLVLPARRHPSAGGGKGGSAADGNNDSHGLIGLTSNEIRRLLATLVLTPLACLTNTIRWSVWRRRRQYQARASHYRRRGHHPPRS